MATEEVPPYAQAVIEKCQLCDREADARYFCEDCKEDMCKQCKTTHLRSKLGKKHTVISTAKEVDEEKQVFCTTHPKKPVHMYCKDCEIPVCLTCIASKVHQSHILEEPADAIDKCRKEHSNYIDHTKQEISKLEGFLKVVAANKKECETKYEDTIDSINNRRAHLKSQVDKAANDLTDDVKKHKTQDVTDLEQQADDFARIIPDKNANIDYCEEMLHTKRGFTVIQLASDFKQKLNLSPSKNLPVPRHITTPKFVSGMPLDIKGVFGELEIGSTGNETTAGGSEDNDGQSEEMCSDGNDKPVGTSTTVTTDTTIVIDIDPGKRSTCISTINEEEAWVADGLSIGSDMALINVNGQVKRRKKMDFKIYDIAVTSEGDVLLTDRDGCSIKKYTQDGQCIDAIDTSPSRPLGICMTSHNDILVCLFGVSGGTRVVRMTTNGTVKQTLKQDQHNKDLFTWPFLISENINGDVCVVDDINPSALVVVNKEGALRFRYPDTSKLFDIYGIACDKHGCIIISDYNNNLIHQIDMDGGFMKHILTQQHGILGPRGLSIDNKGKLWICNRGGTKLTVVKYRSQ